jgi:copper chaperone
VEKITLTITGMSCEHCVKAVKTAAESLPGVASADVNLSAGTASVEYDPTACTPEQLKQAIEEQGYDVA